MATCGEVLVKILENYGIEVIFGIPGVHTVELYRGLGDSSIRHVTPRHEQGAGFMADGYSRSSGKVAACFIITGPGMTNIATAMGQALADSIPMLVISAVSNTHQLGLGRGYLHEMPNQRNLTSGVTRFTHTLFRPDELPEVLARAFTVFNSQRPGPVHIEIPIDVITADADHLDCRPYSIPSPPSASTRMIQYCVDKLNSASRPLIAVGGGCRNASPQVIRLAEKIDAPVINTVNAKGVIGIDHPLAVGGSGSLKVVRDLIADSDLILAIGTEFGETDYDYFFMGPVKTGGELIRIDIDAEQLNRNVRPDLAICSDATLALDAINDLMAKLPNASRQGEERTARIRKTILGKGDPGYDHFFESIRKELPSLIIAGDSNQPVYYAWLHYEVNQPRKYFHSASGFGTLGYAIPAAVGAKLANPDLPVMALIGDGSAQFTLTEMASAVEANTAVIFLIWNNTGYSEIKRFMADRDIPQIGVDIHTPDFQGIAKAMGCDTARVVDFASLQAALKKAAVTTRPMMIEVVESDLVGGPPRITS
ncbi:MAG: acetolactate synthase-1/2/3 large subunit [Gammaproteobacteria bacterium]|jgi:acetolactate synthase-1/2/3 large subunit